MSNFWADFVWHIAPWCVGSAAACFALEKLEAICHYHWSRQHTKTRQAALELRKARYESLGVNCHGHCYLFGCRYERITDELHALGAGQDGIEALVETLNGVEHRKPCACGQALLPLGIKAQPVATTSQQEPSCDTAASS